jgi:hypothetical protein
MGGGRGRGGCLYRMDRPVSARLDFLLAVVPRSPVTSANLGKNSAAEIDISLLQFTGFAKPAN